MNGQGKVNGKGKAIGNSQLFVVERRDGKEGEGAMIK